MQNKSKVLWAWRPGKGNTSTTKPEQVQILPLSWHPSSQPLSLCHLSSVEEKRCSGSADSRLISLLHRQCLFCALSEKSCACAHTPTHYYYHDAYRVVYKYIHPNHSSGAVWESRWTSWAVRPNEPSGFRGHKDLLNRASALVTTSP